MKLYLSKGSIWTGTQADAKAAQGSNDFETIEVPTDKPSLIRWLNERESTGAQSPPVAQEPETAVGEAPAPPPDEPAVRPAQMERFEALARKLGWSPPGTPAVKPTITIDAIEEVIESSEGNSLIRVLGSSISRLGEVAGIRGWAAFTKNVYAWSPGAKSVEQGMGMLMLAAFNNFGAAEKSATSDNSSD